MRKILHHLITSALFIICSTTVKAQSCYAFYTYTNLPGTTVIQFNDTSWYTGTATYTWSFGDGSSSALQNPLHTYNGTGPFIACLTIATNTGCTSTYCDTISFASQSCAAGFSFSLVSGNNVFQFTNQSVSSGTPYYYWTFGDGSTSTQTNPSHTYATPGTYTVCLWITDSSQQCSDQYCTQLLVQGTSACQAYFTTYTDTTTHTTYFYDQSTGSPTNWVWVVDNIYTMTGQNPSYQFPTPGWHWACLTISDSATQCYDMWCDSIYVPVGNGTTCSAMFSYTVQNNVVSFAGIPSGTYTGYIWNFGDGSTSTQLNPVHTYASPGIYTVCFDVYYNGAVCSQSCQVITVQGTAGTDTICGVVFEDLNGNGVMDPGEQGIVNAVLYGWSQNGSWFTVQTNTSGQYMTTLAPGQYTLTYCAPMGYTFTVPLGQDSGGCSYYYITVVAGQNQCGLNYGIQNNSVTIEGTVFIDANNNGILDTGENGIPYQWVIIGTYYAYTDANGNYSAIVPAGTYLVSYTPSGAYTGYTVTTPASYTVNAGVIGNVYGGNHFGIYITPGTVNLSVSIIPHTTVTPGFPAWYDIQVCNIGANSTGAILTMNYDTGLVFDYASPVQASHNATTHTLTWNIPVLTPGDCEYIWVDFNAMATLNVGDNTFENVFVTPAIGSDVDMTNNFDSVHQVVTASWDPNNKLSVQTNTFNANQQTISSLNSDQWITYTINFQNTGTSPAVNIVVIDQLSADLDASTFMLLNTSHVCTVTRNNNVVNYNFSGIWLPDATTNEPASHGFVTFRVKSNIGLPVWHVISDDAAIYFDFNAPVITAPALVTMIGPLASQNQLSAGLKPSVYPNPFNEKAFIGYTLIKNSRVLIEVYDLSGKKVLEVVNEKQDAGNYKVGIVANVLSRGMYLLKANIDGKVTTQKISVTE